MSDDRNKLIQIIKSLESDYKAGKISRDKYNYFRSKYEDKLNSIDAVEASMRIRSMQGKPNKQRLNSSRRKPTRDKKKQEQDLVQKYIINPKKDDIKYKRKNKSSIDTSTFKLLIVLVLVIGFTAGIAYGVFNFDFDSVANTPVAGIVEDTAFPEVSIIPNETGTNWTTFNTTIEEINKTTEDTNSSDDVETTKDTSSSKNKKSNSHDSSDSKSKKSNKNKKSDDSNSKSKSKSKSSSSKSSSSQKSNSGSTSSQVETTTDN